MKINPLSSLIIDLNYECANFCTLPGFILFGGLFSLYSTAVIQSMHAYVSSITQHMLNTHPLTYTPIHKRPFPPQLNMLCSLSIKLIIAQGGLYKLLAAFISIISYPSSFPHTFFRESFRLVSFTCTQARTHTHTHGDIKTHTVGNPLLSFGDSSYHLAYELLSC